MKNFAITGVAGYIAPRHLKAIRGTGNRLVAALDPHDSVGILDSFFENVSYFREFERFDRYLEKLRRDESEHIDYISICAPNYLHDSHIRFAIRIGADAICEKPLVLSPWNLDSLAAMAEESGRKINTILQLRLHPTLMDIREKLRAEGSSVRKQVVLTYITARGNWYLHSWKGDREKAGGLSTNIGIHFFDLLIWLFGDIKRSELHLREATREAGFMELQGAEVRWFLSIDSKDLPFAAVPGKLTTFRSITLDGKEIEFSEGFADLHTESYRNILSGRGFGVEDARASIEIAYGIRTSTVKVIDTDTMHPFLLGRKYDSNP